MVLKGKSVFGGIAIGKIAVYKKKENTVKRNRVEDTAAEVLRFEQAKEQAKQELSVLYYKALKEVGEVNAAIFEVHQMMLDDLDYVESITNMICAQEVNAEFAQISLDISDCRNRMYRLHNESAAKKSESKSMESFKESLKERKEQLLEDSKRVDDSKESSLLMLNKAEEDKKQSALFNSALFIMLLCKVCQS